MFRYGIFSTPIVALLGTLCPIYTLGALALSPETEADAANQTVEQPNPNYNAEGGMLFDDALQTPSDHRFLDTSLEEPVLTQVQHSLTSPPTPLLQGEGSKSYSSASLVNYRFIVDSFSLLGKNKKAGEETLAPPSLAGKGAGGLGSSDLPTENRYSFQQSTPQPAQTTPEIEQPDVKIPVHQIQVIGSTVFSSEQLNPITQPLEGKSVTLEELRGITKAITKLYLDSGYITSRAVLLEQKITDGIVQIQIFEGSLEEIKIEGQQRLNPDYIRQRIRLGATTPLRADLLEDQLRLLRTDPLFEKFDASLQSGKEIGQSILVVRVKEAKAFYGNLSIDNYSPPSVGSERFGVALGYRNLTGIGDDLSGSYYRSTTGGSSVIDLNYRVPFNAMNGTVQLRTVLDRNQVTQPPFDKLNIEGESNLYEINIRQPVIRTPRQELALSLGFSYKDGQTFLFDRIPFPFGIGADDEGVTRTSVFRFGQDYVNRDVQGAWVLRSQFSLGTGLFDATTNEHPTPDSRFFSWLGQVQRVQRVGNDHLLIVQGDLQLTPDSLLPSEQFVIGGGQSLRGYRQNVRSGDNGFRFAVEDRITLERNEVGGSIFQIVPSINMGQVWNHSGNPNQQPSQTFLASAGIGMLWEPLPRLLLKLDYAVPFIDLNDRGTNAQDDGFYFSVNYGF